ncbi:MAG TPA: NAD(P)-binding domain-containing protein [Nevskiaceae bacterium]|nr:NAD(P)-binding domain-containing protein [Nevskiaceae bacterium]
MKIGVLGSGDVARTLAAGCVKHGHDVLVGTRETAKLGEWLRANPRTSAGSFADAAGFGDVVVLAVKGSVAARALRLAGTTNLVGKIVIDACNPIADQPPVNGVLRFFTSLEDSLMERLQKEFSVAKFVKAFSCVGHPMMVNPQVAGGPPTMFICGNDVSAKQAVTGLLKQFGWEAADMGSVEAARAIEPLCMLWCIPALRDAQRTHAFKLLRG